MRLAHTAVAGVVTMLVAGAVPAVAAGPPGDDDSWTFLRNDGYKHYACKYRSDKQERWRVKTASQATKSVSGTDIGVYAAIARGSNGNVVAEKTADAGAWVRLSFRGLQGSDRLWIQAAAYGPASPWSDGDGVAGLRRCADPR